MEHSLISTHWPIDVAGKDDVGRDAKDPNPVKQDSGGDCSGKRDSIRDRQNSGPHRREIRQIERQD